jgi:hypothetical protein
MLRCHAGLDFIQPLEKFLARRGTKNPATVIFFNRHPVIIHQVSPGVIGKERITTGRGVTVQQVILDKLTAGHA